MNKPTPAFVSMIFGEFMRHVDVRHIKTYSFTAAFALAASLLNPISALAQDQALPESPGTVAQAQIERAEETPESTQPLEESQPAATETASTPSSEPEAQGLEVGEELAGEAVGAPTAVREIGSFSDLIPYLSVRQLPSGPWETHKRLVLESGSYKLTKDFEISLTNPYFADKKDYIEHGILSVVGSLSFDGNGHTIKFPDKKARGLFGSLGHNEQPSRPEPHVTKVQNLTLDFTGDVLGFPFAEQARGYQTPNADGLPATESLLKNITLNVAGNVDSIPSHGLVLSDNHFANGNFYSNMATGFSWYLAAINCEDLDINIGGNVGSETASTGQVNFNGETAPITAASYGFTSHFDRNLPSSDTAPGKKLRAQYRDNNNPAPLRNTGHVQNLSLTVGGNIQAVSNNLAYAAGLSNDVASAWVDNAKIDVGGDIAAVMNTGFKHPWRTEMPYAYGIAENTGVLMNSSLSVNNIRFSSPETLDGSASPAPANNVGKIGVVGYDDNHGYHTNISNNTFNIKESVTAKTGLHLISHIGHGMRWNSSGKYGLNWVVVNKDNKYSVGKVDLTGMKGAQIVFDALGKKTRTGERDDASLPKLPEVALENTTLNVGEFKISNPKGSTWVNLGQSNIAGAKNNFLTYGNVTVETNNLREFNGLGGLKNEEPETNVYEPITQNNHLVTGDITLTANDASYVSLMFGSQPTDHAVRNNSARVKSFALNVNDENATRQTLVGGITPFARGELTGNRVYVGDFTVNSKKTNQTWISPGIAFATGAKITDNSVFVDKNISIGHAGKGIIGGFMSRAIKATSVTGSSFQLGGVQETSGNGLIYGAFAGQLDGSTVSSSSALNLNDFAPFVYQSTGSTTTPSTLDGVALYNNAALPNSLPALQLFGSTMSVVKNSTLLVPAEHADSPLYFADHVIGDQSVNNYVVAVNDKDGELNRIAYSAATEKTVQVDDQGTEKQVIARAAEAEPVGSINIAERAFQSKYWTNDVSAYVTGADESDFSYMNKDSSNKTIEAFLVDKGVVSADLKQGKLADYYHRHAGLRVAGGPVYDLLGIPVVDKLLKPTPEPSPSDTPTSSKTPKPEPGKPKRSGLPKTGGDLVYGLGAVALLLATGSLAMLARRRRG
ncbi:LPXTG cell wall anchor domain-containing protein [Actinotignum urinale]|uniref:LPXTG cell wall anchor domain-containing protein n=2 Tax=Actinotignum urinale TaxID=190146 RepID=A0ABU5G6N9_9ACTO|nr:LPXTG cell wall anchor domain-containing protein [Actinotignum urinale]MDY5133023.1 LPXTG cell wall anchor domain-containing protein [Actinotignum urinale]